MKSLFIYVIILFSVQARAEFEKMTFNSKKIKDLRIINASGKLSVYASFDKNITVEFEKIRFPDSCKLDFKETRKQLKVEVKENRKGYDDESCLVNFRIRVPESLNLDITNGLGDLEVLGLKNRVKYMIGSGNVDLSGDFRELIGKVGNGKQALRGYSKSSSLESGRGGFFIELDRALHKDSLLLKNGTGDASVSLPDASNVNIQLQSGLGKLFSDFPTQTSKQAFAIKMRSGTGALRVKKN